jgi:hypothetical protein
VDKNVSEENAATKTTVSTYITTRCQDQGDYKQRKETLTTVKKRSPYFSPVVFVNSIYKKKKCTVLSKPYKRKYDTNGKMYTITQTRHNSYYCTITGKLP